MAEKIQTLHPQEGKTNKRIDVDKYNFIREHLIAMLQEKDCTHTELMELLYQKVKDNFEGGVQWYGETVKLDLEARNIIERIGTKPEKYRMVLSPHSMKKDRLLFPSDITSANAISSIYKHL